MIRLLRALLTEEVVTFEGRWHSVPQMGICPLPVRRPVPLWLGGHADVSLCRFAIMGDGWMTLASPVEAREAAFLERLRRYLAEARRSPAEVGIEATVSMANVLIPGDLSTSRPPAAWAADVAAWRNLGATHLSLSTVGTGLCMVDAYMAALRRFLDLLS